MTKFLSTAAIILQMETIIGSAKTELVLISPMIKLPNMIFTYIQDANKRQVKIKLVFAKADLNQDTIDQLKQLSNLSMYCSPNLHAKCYFNETSMMITSLGLNNLFDSNNIEMGVLVTKKSDTDLYNAAVKEAGEIIKNAEITNLEKAVKDKQTDLKEAVDTGNQIVNTEGLCIRCKTKIIFDPLKPLCKICYQEWLEWDYQDPGYPEKYCHQCGNKWATSLESPFCSVCSTPNNTNDKEL